MESENLVLNLNEAFMLRNVFQGFFYKLQYDKEVNLYNCDCLPLMGFFPEDYHKLGDLLDKIEKYTEWPIIQHFTEVSKS